MSSFREEIEKYPAEPKLFLFGIAAAAFRKIPGTRVLNEWIFKVTPDLPFSLWESLQVKSKWLLFWLGYLTTLAFCFGVTALLCFVEGTWSASAGESFVALSADTMNLFFYTFLSPVIVGFSVILWVETARTWRTARFQVEEAEDGVDLRFHPEVDEATASRGQRWSFLRWLFAVNLILVIATLAISNYMADVANSGTLFNLNPGGEEKGYWFLGSEAHEGLRPITVHYMFINFLLLVNTLATIGFFVTAARPIVDLARNFERAGAKLRMTFEELKSRTEPFINVYLCAKILVALHIVHVWVWSWSEDLANTENKIVEIAFLALIGVFFIAVPRYHLESEWYKLQAGRLAGDRTPAIEHDLRGRYTKLAVHLLDTLIIGGFLLSWLPSPGKW